MLLMKTSFAWEIRIRHLAPSLDGLVVGMVRQAAVEVKPPPLWRVACAAGGTR